MLGRTPNRGDCDAVSTEVPVICWRRCYHIVVANSKALEGSSIWFNRIVPDYANGTHSFQLQPYRARQSLLQVCGVTSASAAGTEGVDVDGETGEPTGVLRENAVKLLQRLMSEEGDREAKREQLRTCLGKLGSVGLVGVQGSNSMHAFTGSLWRIPTIYSRLAKILTQYFEPLCSYFISHSRR